MRANTLDTVNIISINRYTILVKERSYIEVICEITIDLAVHLRAIEITQAAKQFFETCFQVQDSVCKEIFV